MSSENQETFAWDSASVADDGRTVTVSGIHPPPWWSSETSWWSFERAEVHEAEEAVSVLLWMRERDPGADDAWVVTDRHQSAVVSLPAPLGNRVLVDGNARLAEATGKRDPHTEAQRVDRITVAGEATAVVYWSGWDRPYDVIDVDLRADEIAITVWQRAGGRAVARYWAAIVQLGEPIAGRRIVDGAVRVSSR